MELKPALNRAQEVTHAQASLFFSEYLPRLASVDPWLTKVGERLQEYCLRPGKAVRPLLVAAGAALSAGTSLDAAFANQRVLRLMLAIELIHKRLILADDVADRDELRNEKPAFHTGWEQDFLADPKYANLSAGFRRHVARSYTEIAGIMLQRLSDHVWDGNGLMAKEHDRINQILLEYVYEKTPAGWYILFDQNFETLDGETSEEVLLKGLELVTGGYTFQAPLLLGAATGAKFDAYEKILIEFGAAAGVLFQLTDDVLGLFGDPEVTGKPVGGDIREGKKTLLVQYAYRLGDGRERKQLQKLVGKQNLSAAEIEVVQEIVRRSGAFDQTQAKIKEYVEFCEATLKRLPEGEIRDLLSTLVKFIASRKS
jgi:geranylgeranyl diphosphate synthase type I